MLHSVYIAHSQNASINFFRKWLDFNGFTLFLPTFPDKKRSHFSSSQDPVDYIPIYHNILCRTDVLYVISHKICVPNFSYVFIDKNFGFSILIPKEATKWKD